MNEKRFLLVSVMLTLSVSLNARTQDLSETVNRHLKDAQWKIDYEKEIRPLELMPKTAPKKPLVHRTPRAATFGVMEHEENPHFDSRPSFGPREKPSVRNLSSWADWSVDAHRKNRQANMARKAEWMRLLTENARRQGYLVKVDPETQLFQLLPIQKSSDAKTSPQVQRKPGSRPTGF